MKAVIQRVAAARVTVAARQIGAIGSGLLVFLGVAAGDTEADADRLLAKLLDLRIFDDEQGKFDASLRSRQGGLLVVSQFTLLADTRKGRRPSFSAAAAPPHARRLYEYFVLRAAAQGIATAAGEFGARMHVELVNDGPVTILLDSSERA